MSVFQQMWITPEDQEYLLELQPGETSHIIQVWDVEAGEPLYFILNVVSRADFDMDEVKSDFRENLILERRHEAFHNRVLEWVDEANFTINERGYNTV